jgi:hypothetical protein
MLANEAFDALAFLCILFTSASVIMGAVYLFYKYVLGVDLDSTY